MKIFFSLIDERSLLFPKQIIPTHIYEIRNIFLDFGLHKEFSNTYILNLAKVFVSSPIPNISRYTVLALRRVIEYRVAK